MKRVAYFLLAGWLSASLAGSWLTAQDTDQSKITRAKRPTFRPADVNTFFRDPLTEALVGERPTNLGDEAPQVAGTDNGSTNAVEETSSTHRWSNVIPADALVAEVRRLNSTIDQIVTTPGRFESGDYRLARLHFSIAAMIFAIINEYDGEVKWKELAPEARELFARMAANATTGSQTTYRQAKIRKDDLREIVNGGSVTVEEEFERANDWERIVDRSPLMIRLELAYTEHLKGWLSSESEMRANADEIRQEAYLVAAIGEVLTREGLPDSEEEDYNLYGYEMRDAALQVISSLDAGNFDAAATAGSLIGQSCQNCHSDWQ